MRYKRNKMLVWNGISNFISNAIYYIILITDNREEVKDVRDIEKNARGCI